MVFARQEFQKIIRGYHNRLIREYKTQKYELVRRIHAVWLQYSTETEVIWIGRWNHEQAQMVLENSQRLSAPVTGKEFEEVIVALYRPIVAYVYTIHSLRVRLQMSKSLEVKHDELVEHGNYAHNILTALYIVMMGDMIYRLGICTVTIKSC